MISSPAKLLIFAGIIFIVAGVALSLVGKIPYVGRLPGDLYIRKENFTFYFPLTTSILISVLFTLLFQLFGKK